PSLRPTDEEAAHLTDRVGDRRLGRPRRQCAVRRHGPNRAVTDLPAHHRDDAVPIRATAPEHVRIATLVAGKAARFIQMRHRLRRWRPGLIRDAGPLTAG